SAGTAAASASLTAAGDRRRIRTALNRRGPAAARAALSRRRRSGNRLAGQNGLEVVVSNGILELLPNEALLHQHIDTRRVRVCELHPVQANRAHVLLAAEEQLLLFF